MVHSPMKECSGWFRPLAAVGAWIVPLLAVLPARADEAPIPPARFLVALDLEGKTHRIGNGEGYKAAAVVFMSHECPISREYVPELNRLAGAMKDKPVKFVGVISERGLTRAAAVKFQQDFKIAFPLLFDASGEIAAALGPTHVPEGFVLDTAGQVVYRGRIDDQYGEIGKKRPEATRHDLAEAIDATLDGKAIAEARTTPVGCPFKAEPATQAPRRSPTIAISRRFCLPTAPSVIARAKLRPSRC